MTVGIEMATLKELVLETQQLVKVCDSIRFDLFMEKYLT